jgi:hypothetical protein
MPKTQVLQIIKQIQIIRAIPSKAMLVNVAFFNALSIPEEVDCKVNKSETVKGSIKTSITHTHIGKYSL